MKLLLLSDEESSGLWDYYQPGKLDSYDLILSCGDLSPQYLSFLATFARAPVVYVHGNHDGIYQSQPPEGCICADDRVVTVNGVRILGLGGCMRYNRGLFQYTEAQMCRRYWRAKSQIRRAGGVDIFLTHAPALGLGDRTDQAHLGFQVFRTILDEHTPALHVHGHIHQCYGGDFRRERTYGATRIINACGFYHCEASFPPPPGRHPSAQRARFPYLI